MKNSILKNNIKQNELDNLGYTILDILDDNTINTILANENINQLTINNNYGYQVSIHEKNKEIRKKISDSILEILKPKLSQTLQNYKMYGATFGNKLPNLNTSVTPHHEWSLVDEDKYRAYTIWIALVDTDAKNGGLFIIPGSYFHNTNKIVRPINTPYFFSYYEHSIKKYAKEIKIKKGQAIVFNQSLIHYSLPNLSKNDRPCVMISLKDQNAINNEVYYLNESNQKIEKYNIDDDFTFEIDDLSNIKSVNGILIESIGINEIIKKYSKDEVNRILINGLYQSNFLKNRYDLFKYITTNTITNLTYRFKKYLYIFKNKLLISKSINIFFMYLYIQI